MKGLATILAGLAALSSGAPPNTEPLWSLKDVADISNLLQKAQGRDRAGFLDLLEDADSGDEEDPDADESTAAAAPDDSPTAPSTAASSTSDSTNSDRRDKKPSRNPPYPGGRRPVLMPPLMPPNLRAGVPPRFVPLDDAANPDDSMKWFNAQAFVKWLVQGLAAFYEGLVHFMLLPLRIVIGFIDV